MRKNAEETVAIIVRVPVSLKAQIDLVLLDPVMGKMKYGSLTKLMVALLRQWLDSLPKQRQQSTGQD